jgi:hypothetical protein
MHHAAAFSRAAAVARSGGGGNSSSGSMRGAARAASAAVSRSLGMRAAVGSVPVAKLTTAATTAIRCRTVASAAAASSSAAASTDAAVSPGANHADLPKNFEHGATEERLYAWWEEQGCFKPDENATVGLALYTLLCKSKHQLIRQPVSSM